MSNSAILVIYTGGTIGMKAHPVTGELVPFRFEHVLEEVPELRKFGYRIDTHSFDPVIDSSNIFPDFWMKLALLIGEQYPHYNGFVILHGTDTMSYTASALSFMLENLEKPVILTGSQLPIGLPRTDGKENFISAVEIAAAVDAEGHALVPEVCIFFQDELFRGNRTFKYNAEEFRAFRSPNYPPLAEAGIQIKYNRKFIRYPKNWGKPLRIHTKLGTDVAILKIFPGIERKMVEAFLNIRGLRALILETYGQGNAPSVKWLLDILSGAVSRGIIILNITQCPAGSVSMESYACGMRLREAGVLSGYDMTTEAAVAKIMLLTGQYDDIEKVKYFLSQSLNGEF
ncbi:MAG: asparaginase [Bacteroidales bacterium]|jgi:L-asparaginase|nr:asparaginase [Bacteroidales bacterium]MDD2264377.1 asparaginase [Bacteroidales bacterium]MDD2831611.1 asparaginase [Bacteroidales bacterium]MDD3209478.1 asparaginase [Bacteroidales bacterium]MDD3697539.1 asparaginase [Bacteroidales bacterium]